MSKEVVAAPEAPKTHAKQPVPSEKAAKQVEKKSQVQDDVTEEEAGAKQTEADQQDGTLNGEQVSETSMSGDFSFNNALAEAAESAGSLITEAEAADEAGFAQFGDDSGSGGVILLVGAVALAGLGIYLLADGGGSSNEPPAFNDATLARTTAEDTPLTITAAAVDPDGDAVTYTVSTAASNGTVAIGTGGSLTYTPNANFNGTDSFVITARDPDGDTDTVTVNVTVTPVADAPTGSANLAFDVDEDDVLEDEFDITDPDAGDTLTYAVTTNPQNGTVVVDADGGFVFTPTANFSGTDSFVVTATDSSGATFVQTVNVTVADVNDDPDFGVDEQTFEIAQGQTLTGTLVATDVEGDPLTYDVETDPTNGTVTVGANGALTYTPDEGFLGEDSFVVNVSDDQGGSDTLTVTVNVLEDLVTEVSIDGNTPGTVDVFDADDGEFVFTDDVSSRTDARIENFESDDLIEVVGADEDDYFFGTGSGAGGADDLRITFNDGTDFTQIVLVDVLTEGFVFDYDSAVASVGFDFMNFG